MITSIKTAQQALEWLAENIDAIAQAKYEADEADGKANDKRIAALTDDEHIGNQHAFLVASKKWRKLYETRNYCQILIRHETSKNFNRQMEHA